MPIEQGENPAYLSFCGEINDSTCEYIVGAVTASVHAGADAVHLQITTNGGLVAPAFHVYHALRALQTRLVVYNPAHVDSAGIAIFLAGRERYRSEWAYFMLHPILKPHIEPNISLPRLKEILDEMVAWDSQLTSLLQADTNMTESELTGRRWGNVYRSGADCETAGLTNGVGAMLLPAGRTMNMIRHA